MRIEPEDEMAYGRVAGAAEANACFPQFSANQTEKQYPVGDACFFLPVLLPASEAVLWKVEKSIENFPGKGKESIRREEDMYEGFVHMKMVVRGWSFLQLRKKKSKSAVR
jgi:hypothetical protein